MPPYRASDSTRAQMSSPVHPLSKWRTFREERLIMAGTCASPASVPPSESSPSSAANSLSMWGSFRKVPAHGANASELPISRNFSQAALPRGPPRNSVKTQCMTREADKQGAKTVLCTCSGHPRCAAPFGRVNSQRSTPPEPTLTPGQPQKRNAASQIS